MTVEQIEQRHSSVFGVQGIDLVTPDPPPPWMELPDDDLAYHVAHELTHIVLRQRGFPKTGRGTPYGEDSAEARIGGDLEEMVLHSPLEKLLLPFGFNHDYIRARMLEGAMNGMVRSPVPVPEPGTPWSFTWAIRYCELQLELVPEQWDGLEAIYKERAPGVYDLGEEPGGNHAPGRLGNQGAGAGGYDRGPGHTGARCGRAGPGHRPLGGQGLLIAETARPIDRRVSADSALSAVRWSFSSYSVPGRCHNPRKWRKTPIP